jgi:hypothetical protein
MARKYRVAHNHTSLMELALATGSWLARLHHHYGSSFLYFFIGMVVLNSPANWTEVSNDRLQFSQSMSQSAANRSKHVRLIWLLSLDPLLNCK